MTILGQTVRWKDWGIEYEADEKHRKIVMEHFGLDENTHGLTWNEIDEIREEENDAEELASGERAFRAIAARIHFLAQDCPYLQFSAKEVCREMSKPTMKSWHKQKGWRGTWCRGKL